MVALVFSFFIIVDFHNFPKTNVIKFIVALKLSHFNYYYWKKYCLLSRHLLIYHGHPACQSSLWQI